MFGVSVTVGGSQETTNVNSENLGPGQQVMGSQINHSLFLSLTLPAHKMKIRFLILAISQICCES